MKRFRQRKAFTIVEMVIVIAVIAILATVLVPTISGVIQKANHSADQQFVASLNVQLALWQVDNGEIANESDLRNAINFYYGTEETPDFYATLSPKSAPQGYHYWWDADENTFVLSKYEGLFEEGDTIVASQNKVAFLSNRQPLSENGEKKPHFSPANPRSLMINEKNYFLVDQKGSDVADIFDEMDILGSDDGGQDYEDMIVALDKLADEGDELVGLILEKLSQTAIITDYGVFRYSADDVAYAHISGAATALNGIVVYEYDEETKKVGSAIEGGDVTTKTDIKIELPSGVKVNVGGFMGFENTGDDSDLKINTPELHVNASIDELKEIFEAGSIDCVIVLPDGSRYEMDVDGIYRLPRTANDTPAVGDLGITSIEKIEIGYNDSNTTQNADDDYFYTTNDTLYLAWDFDSAKLVPVGIKIEGEEEKEINISSGMIEWTVSDGALISVAADGTITLKDGAKPVAAKATATVTATLKSDATKVDTITVQLVFPTQVEWTFANASPSTNTAPNTNTTIKLSYTEAVKFALTGSVKPTQDGYVKMNSTDLAVQFTTTGSLFSITNNELTLVPKNITSRPTTQDLTVTYGNYVSQTYTVEVTDDSSVGLKKNQITTGVTMGDYLFRVGNNGAIALGKLFSAVEQGKVVDVQAVNIYDAAKTTNNQRAAINTKEQGGFWATYTSNTDWANATVQFGGTGVAIIEVKTAKGNVELAVEVMDAKNVTSAGDFSGATNYVLLNDIAWGTSKNIGISGTIYGNGFAINAATYLPTVESNTAMFNLNGGTIDNLVINGPVYPELSYSGETYYVVGIRTMYDAKIVNSYISGFRAPVWAAGTSIHLENTTLVGGNYGNLWVEKDLKVYLKDVTTIQKQTNATVGDTSKKILGAGIIIESGISNLCDVVIDGKFNQHNWVTEADLSNFDAAVKPLINTMFSESGLYHTVNGTKHINAGILFVATRTNTINDCRTDTEKSSVPYGMVNLSGNFLGSNVSATVYTHIPSPAVTTIPTYGGYTPNKQAALKPTFKDNLTKADGKVVYSIDIPGGATATLDTSVYTVAKYSGQNIAVNVTCSGTGVSMNGKKITFSKAGTYTVTYTVTDNAFFNADGSRNENSVVDTYTVTVVVSNSNHSNATINVDSINMNLYMNLENTTTDPDYAAAFAILDGLVITDYNEDGSSFKVSIPANALPTGLTVTATGFKGSASTFVHTDGKLYLYDTSARADQNGYSTVKITYKYIGKNGKTVEKTVTHNNVGTNKYTPLQDNRTSTCFTPDTLVTLADGTQKRVDELKPTDTILAWDFFTGKYVEKKISLLVNHGEALYKVVNLEFSDGTDLRLIGEHGVFDYDLNKYVYFTAENYAEYIGHNFVKQNLNGGYNLVQLVDGTVTEEYTSAWSVSSAETSNAFASGMLTVAPPEDFYNWIEMSGKLQYNVEQFAADVEKYGLYTYEDFADYVTYEQFVDWNGAYLKIAVEKGYFTFEYILELIEMYKSWMP